jgi:hypothetical protein
MLMRVLDRGGVESRLGGNLTKICSGANVRPFPRAVLLCGEKRRSICRISSLKLLTVPKRGAR